MERFDVAVVGGGLIGSSAARHLAEAGHRTVVIASPEPEDWSSHTGPFASHYDSGRITRVISADPAWAELAKRSIERYDDIATRSGINFHDPRGLAWIGIGIEEAVNNSIRRGGNARMVAADWLYATTGIRTPSTPGLEVAYEAAPAGVVNPRRLAAAQLRLAELANATIVRAAATSVRNTAGGVTIAGPFGDIEAGRLLLATGAYGAELVGVSLAAQRLLRTTLRVDLGHAHSMPSLILDPVDHPHIGDLYWNPPVPYPDGRRLFKVGCEIENAPVGETLDDVVRWFASDGDPVEADALLTTSRSLLPGANFRSWETVPCMITRTASRYPYLGWVEDKVAVAVGGNGSSAKSCDEIGRLASTLFNPGGWDDPVLDAAQFAPIVAST
jgi:sarcosine oxidase